MSFFGKVGVKIIDGVIWGVVNDVRFVIMSCDPC